MVDIKKFIEMDLYGLIGVELGATDGEIRKSYRKKALACHPDKNPDNPKAAELFHQLSKALELLLDTSARAAYDKVIQARKAAEIRNKQLDSKRQKLKSDLESREREAFANAGSKTQGHAAKPRTPEEILRAEMERLRDEGSRLLEEEQELMRQQLASEKIKQANHFDPAQYRIKIKWTAKADDAYTEESLRQFLKKYGDLNALVMSKKNSSALIEFATKDAAEMAIAYEKGHVTNPLTLEWVKEPTSATAKVPYKSSTIKDTDYESLVLRQMRQAEERKRLIEQMQEENDE